MSTDSFPGATELNNGSCRNILKVVTEMQSYKIQMQIQVLPDVQGCVKYNALDLKEIR